MTDAQHKIWTVPNGISMLRIAMIPLFAWAYLQGRLWLALVVLVLSGISDKLDGTIARKYNLVSDLGKLLDPLADKLTQVTLALLLFFTFLQSDSLWMHRFAWVFLLFLAKEFLMLAVGLVLLCLKRRPAAAELWGKISTFVFYCVMILLFLVGPESGVLATYYALPPLVVQALVLCSLLLTLVALVSYIPGVLRSFRSDTKPRGSAPTPP